MTYTTLIEAFQIAVNDHPEDNALVVNNTTFTYSELYRISSHHAKVILASSSSKKLNRIAFFANRTTTSYISTLIANMCGAAFVPLNPKFPPNRNISILEQCKPEIIIVDNESIADLLNVAEQIEIPSQVYFTDSNHEQYSNSKLKFIDTNGTLPIQNQILPSTSANDVAYILFTSGSTGTPKGVPITHANVCSFIQYNQNRYSVSYKDRVSQTFEQTFDLSIFDLFMAWCNGACIYGMRPIDLLSPFRYINDNGITIWFSVPSVITLVYKQGFLKDNCFPTLRLSLFCGEPLFEGFMSLWAKAAPNSICENLYGPTELTIACSHYRWNPHSSNIVHNKIVSIGRLYPHMNYILVNDDSTSDLEGELCVDGTQRFDGYLNSDSNAKCFMLKEKPDGSSARYYRTGDYVKLTASGDLVYLGRKDQQIKINGYRIEIGEIESALLSIERVEHAIVFSFHDKEDSASAKLGAYLVGNIPNDHALEKAKELLPHYMIPAKLIIAKDLPLNSNGKVDRNAIRNFFEMSIMC